MARLQDFQNVTPTSSDKILIVQSQGQGLAPHTIKMDSANPTGTGALSLNRKANTTTGTRSVAVGYNCTASGTSSFAEGDGTTASGDYSHAEGIATTASGVRSHAEGSATVASGARGHAEGNGAVASGDNSHAEGTGTVANHRAQHVFGEFNAADTSTAASSERGNYVEIVGNGVAGAGGARNARTLDWNGNEVLAGGLKINGNQDVGTETPWGFSMAQYVENFGNRTAIVKGSHFIICTVSIKLLTGFTITNADTKIINFTTNLGIGTAIKNTTFIATTDKHAVLILKNDGLYLGDSGSAGLAVDMAVYVSVAFAI